MSRGLTDSPVPEEQGPTIADLDNGLRELYGHTADISVRLEQLEAIIAKAIKFNLPEDEAEGTTQLRGL